MEKWQNKHLLQVHLQMCIRDSVKVIATKTLRNKAINTALKTDIKKANIALENKDANTAEAVKVAIRAIDKATAKGILHKNTAARKKSALAQKLNAVNA